GGRGLSVDLGIADELREQRDWTAWSALSGATTARPNPLLIAISNAGDDGSVVLNSLRSAGLAFIDSGEGDDSLGLFEWSAPDDAEIDDRAGWAAANPALGVTITEQTLAGKMAAMPAAEFRTEHLCQRVAALDGAIDPTAWRNAEDLVGDLSGLRDRVAVGFDVAPDGQHATLVAAAVLDSGKVRCEVVEAWDSTEAARRALPGLLERVKPVAVAWYPSGPAAALAADLRAYSDVELKGAAVMEACMELADLVQAGRVVHPGDDLLTTHVTGAQKLRSADGYRFVRRGAGHVDAAYALAAAVHAARTLPEPEPAKPRSAVF